MDILGFLTGNVWRTATIALGLALVVSNGVQQVRVSSAQRGEAKAMQTLAEDRAAASEALAKAEAAAREAETRHAARVAEIETNLRKEQADAQERADRVVAELRAGERRLRQQWADAAATAKLSAAAAAADGSDGTTDDRAAAVGRVLRIGAEADARIRALQDVIRSMHQATAQAPH